MSIGKFIFSLLQLICYCFFLRYTRLLMFFAIIGMMGKFIIASIEVWQEYDEKYAKKKKQQQKVNMPPKKDPYQLLGITSYASKADIKKAYRSFVSVYHPDILAAKLDKQELTEKEYREREEDVKIVNAFYDSYR